MAVDLVAMRKRKSHPYLMRGAPKVTEARATVLDPPDPRVPELTPRKLSPKELALIGRETRTDPRLRAIDRCFERWAATPTTQSVGPRLACIIIIGHDGTAAPPLDDAESKIVDAVVRVSPRWASEFVRLWYRTELPVTEIARTLKIKHRQYVYAERQMVLGYYLGRIEEAMKQLLVKSTVA